MIKTLFVLRHAHSSEKMMGQHDKLRELSREGVNGAIKIGTYIKNQNINIDHIFSSSATRAITTATIVANGIGYNPTSITEIDELYLASIRSMVELINQFREEHNNVILVGHNPHLSYLAEFFCKTELGSMPPGGLAIIQFKNLKWNEITKNAGDLLNFTSPELLD